MTSSPAQRPKTFAFDSPHDALRVLLDRLDPAGEERIDLQAAHGRVLSRPILADRDSPPHDVSAMDGYAVRASTIQDAGSDLAVVQEVPIGQPPPDMPSEGCLKISTGACVPEGCDGVIPREHVDESAKQITVPPGYSLRPGQNIRRQGENLRLGEQVIAAGLTVHPPTAAALAAFGQAEVWAHRRVRISVLTTGNELQGVDATPAPWQIRDSNTPTLVSGLSRLAWIDVVDVRRLQDRRASIADALQEAAKASDLILTTGGVSMGDHDYLKPALIDVGGQVVFHKLPIRPGKPVLTGLIPAGPGQERSAALVGLPGNPVAVAVGLPLFVSPVARRLGGYAQAAPPALRVRVTNPPAKGLSLWRYLPAKLAHDGTAELLSTKGSGDLASAAVADGYVELPPDQTETGPWAFYPAS